MSKEIFRILFIFTGASSRGENNAFLTLASLISPFKNKEFMESLIHKSNLPKDILKKDIQIDAIYLMDYFSKSPQFIHSLKIDLKRKIAPDILCVSAMSTNIEEALIVAHLSSYIYPKTIRVIGGSHASVRAQDFLKNGLYHVACLGEGTETIVQIAAIISSGLKDFRNLQGIVFYDNDKIRLNKRSSFLFELDDYPWFSLSLYDLIQKHLPEKTLDIITILGGIGCPHNCYYCAQKSVHLGFMRKRSAESLIQEIEYWVDRGFKRFFILTENFTSDKKILYNFLDLIDNKRLKIEWMVQSDAICLNVNDIRHMANSGLKVIEFGIESGDPNVLTAINKNTDLKHALKLIHEAKRLGIFVDMFFLVGLPYQDDKSIEMTKKFMEDAEVDDIEVCAAINIAVPYPGTTIQKECMVQLLMNDDGHTNFPLRKPKDTYKWTYTRTNVATSTQIENHFHQQKQMSTVVI